jgi:WD40 repeat protein
MKINQQILLLLFIAVTYPCISQEKSIWYFGNQAGVEFYQGKAKAIKGGNMHAVEGCALLHDKNGKVVFYSNGDTVFNALNQPMKNGTGLMGYWSSTQGVLILPYPGKENNYLLMTTDAADFSGAKGLRYSVVDLSAEKGLGAVTEKNEILMTSSSEKLTAIKHYNGKDYWIVAHGATDGVYSSFLLTSEGFSKQAITTRVGPLFNTSISPGQMKFSPDGSMLAAAYYSNLIYNANIFHFDNKSGKLNDAISIRLPSSGVSVYGLEFSPDSRNLFLSSTMEKKIFVTDLAVWDETKINASLKCVGNSQSTFVWGMQLATDGKIYVSHDNWPGGDPYLGVLEFSENSKTWQYTDKGLFLNGGLAHLGLPNVVNFTVPGYFYSDHEPYAQRTTHNNEIGRELKPGDSELKVLHLIDTYDDIGNYYRRDYLGPKRN